MTRSTDNHPSEDFNKFKLELCQRLGQALFSSYFEGMEIEWDADGPLLRPKNGFAAQQIEQRFSNELLESWAQSVAPVSSLRLAAGRGNVIIVRSSRAALRGPLAADTTSVPSRSLEVDVLDLPEHIRAAADGWHGFEGFWVSESNRLARHAAMRVAEGLTRSVTYIYGGVGRGKTHLLTAVASEWAARFPGRTVMRAEHEQFIERVVSAVLNTQLTEMRRAMLACDLLILDDVHLYAGRKRTQDELALILERRTQAGKPTIAAGAGSPAELAGAGLLPRLADRLNAGLSVQINKPDFELRLCVARRYFEALKARLGRTLADRHIELIARRCDTDLRELIGIVRFFELVVESEGQNPTLTDDQVRQILAERIAGIPERSLSEILAFTATAFDLSVADLRCGSRRQPLVRARQAFCIAARRFTTAPLQAIGDALDRDHTTVLNAIKKGTVVATQEEQFAERLNRVLEYFDRA